MTSRITTLDGPLHRRVHRIYDVRASLSLVEPPEWTRAAVCASVDPELFYPEKGGSVREAKQVCAGCPVRAECLQYALDGEERFGVFGGLSERERRRLTPRRRSGPSSAGIGRGGDFTCQLNGCAYSGASIAALRKHRDRWHKAAA